LDKDARELYHWRRRRMRLRNRPDRTSAHSKEMSGTRHHARVSACFGNDHEAGAWRWRGFRARFSLAVLRQ